MALGLIVTPEGEVERKDFLSLADYQKAVDGYIEYVVPLVEGSPSAYVNEEFLYQDFEDNIFGSVVLYGANRVFDGRVNVIKGNVIFLGDADEEGETLDLDEKLMSGIEGLVKAMRVIK